MEESFTFSKLLNGNYSRYILQLLCLMGLFGESDLFAKKAKAIMLISYKNNV